MTNNIADIRKDYKLKSLLEADVSQDPFVQFNQWWEEAIASNIDEVNAMTLATVGSNGKPSARIVLLKGIDKNGFHFFTNYESHKAKDMDANNNVALIIFWKELERQIRIEGTAIKLTDAESDAYYFSRPLDSQIGAWSSPQSNVISSRTILDENVAAIKSKFETEKITRPDFWGGYTVQPSVIEFWQGRSNRLHDRLQYTKLENDWKLERLAP
jgi:pyridoxamine 5'-phosphate oxidase